MSDLLTTAQALMEKPKGFVAADESKLTATKRLESIGLPSTEETRRQYRDVFLTTPGIGEYLSGVIFFDETLRQNASDGRSFIEVLQSIGVIPGIKVDAGTIDLPGFPGEKVTEGLDGLGKRLAEYAAMGARFAKWRAVIAIVGGIPTNECLLANAHALARYAALCQANGIVPVVEPEVLIDGTHDLARSEEVTMATLQTVFAQLEAYRVNLAGTILKSSMVISGKECPIQATPAEIAEATLRCFKKAVPEDLAGIVFLSGGQTPRQATENLNAIAKASQGPWPISFSYARALQSEALKAWAGKPENYPAAQEVFMERLKAVSAAVAGQWIPDLEP